MILKTAFDEPYVNHFGMFWEGFKIPTIRNPTIIIPTCRDFNWVRRDFDWVRRDFNWVSRDFNWVRRDFNWVRLLTL